MKSVDIIIPAYRPGKEFDKLLKRLQEQEHRPEKIIIMNTEAKYWDVQWENKYPLAEVYHLSKEDFDHGGTRKRAAEISKSEIMIFMTQDALPCNKQLIGNLVKALENEKVGAAYARQLPKEDCRFLERYTRSFNYPEESSVKYKKDIEKYGVKTYFCSNVCAAYKKNVYEEVGGFVEKAIFNEDMICAGNIIKAGYGIAYAADACVLHSHNYSALQQLHRNFDLGVSQAEHPEIFAEVPSEGEGIRLVKKSLSYLCKTAHIWLIPQLIIQSGCKYAGYFLGKRYKSLPKFCIKRLTMNPSYWLKEK